MYLVKLILSLLLMISGAMIGIYLSGRLRRRMDVLNSMKSLLEKADSRMIYKSDDLYEAFCENEFDCRFTRDCPFDIQWRELINASGSDLKDDDKKLLLSFSDGLGNSDIDSQHRHIGLYIKLLDTQIKKAENEIVSKGKLCRILPICLSIAIAILMI